MERAHLAGALIFLEPSEAREIFFERALELASIVKYSSDRLGSEIDNLVSHCPAIAIATHGEDGLEIRKGGQSAVAKGGRRRKGSRRFRFRRHGEYRTHRLAAEESMLSECSSCRRFGDRRESRSASCRRKLRVPGRTGSISRIGPRKCAEHIAQVQPLEGAVHLLPKRKREQRQLLSARVARLETAELEDSTAREDAEARSPDRPSTGGCALLLRRNLEAISRFCLNFAPSFH